MTNTNVTINDTDFKKIERMSKLTLKSDEKDVIHSQLDEALKAIKVFDELDLTEVPPLEHPGGLKNVMRPDVITPSFTQDQALINAPAKHDGYVMVPGVFEEQSWQIWVN